MEYVVLRRDSEDQPWGGASVVEAKSEKAAVQQAAGQHPGEYGVFKLPKDIAVKTVSPGTPKVE